MKELREVRAAAQGGENGEAAPGEEAFCLCHAFLSSPSLKADQKLQEQLLFGLLATNEVALELLTIFLHQALGRWASGCAPPSGHLVGHLTVFFITLEVKRFSAVYQFESQLGLDETLYNTVV